MSNPTRLRGPSSDPAAWGSVYRFMVGQLCSGVGALALTTALGLQVFDLTKSTLALGFLGLAEFLPSLMLVLVTGSLADRLDRRRMASVSLAVQAVVIAGIGLYTLGDPSSALPLFAFVVAFGIARAFAGPAIRSMPVDLAKPGHLPWLAVRFTGLWQVSTIVGPVLGGVLYAVDPALLYFVIAGLSAFAAGVAATIRYAPHVRPHRAVTAVAEPLDAIGPGELETAEIEAEADESVPTPGEKTVNRLREALEGARFIRRNPVLFGAITLDLAAVLFGGALALLPAIAEDRLGVGAVGLGWLRASVGIGAGLTTLALAWRPVQRHIGHVLLVVVAIFGAGTVVLGATTSYAVAFVALAVLSGADAVSMFIRSTITPLITPNEMRGRVLAFEMVLIGASNELGAFESGVTGALLGAPLAIVIGGLASVAVAGIWWFGFPALRRLDRFPQHGERTLT